MGGAWDATNVIDAAVAVVLPIAVDHAKYLGDSPEAIAVEKAGIIKPGSVAVLAEQSMEAADRPARPGQGGRRDRGPRGPRVRCGQPGRCRGRPGDDPQGTAHRLRRGLPAAVRRPPGPERRRRAGRGGGVRRRPAARRRAGARGVRERHLARPAGGHPPQPDDRARRRPQPARGAGRRGGTRRLLPVLAADRRGRRDGRQGRRRRAGGVRAALRARHLHPELHRPRSPGGGARRDRDRDLRRGPGDRGAQARRRHRPGRGPRRGRGGVRRPTRVRCGPHHRLGGHRRRGPQPAQGSLS